MERKAFGKPSIEVHTGNTRAAQPASLCTLHIIAALLGSCMANPHTSTKECPSRLPIWPLGLSLLVWCATEAPGRLTRVAETPTTPPSQKPWQLTWPTRLQRMLYRWACSHTGTRGTTRRGLRRVVECIHKCMAHAPGDSEECLLVFGAVSCTCDSDFWWKWLQQ